jgi:hypothetical protein
MMNMKVNLRKLLIDMPWGQKSVWDAFTVFIVMLVDCQKTVADYRNVNDCEMRSQYDKV